MAAAVALFGIFPTATVQAQSEWTEPVIVYETGQAIDAPFVIADSLGGTHLVWREYEGEAEGSNPSQELLFFANHTNTWSNAVDIVVGRTAVGPSLAVDASGLIHLIWVEGNTLFHSLASLSAARTALGWSQPTAIANSGLRAHAVADAAGMLHVVFPGPLSSGPYYLSYDIEQNIWSSPIRISPTRPGASADYTRMAIGQDGTLHVVWSEFQLPDAWPPTGVYYARSTDRGNSWSTAVELAGAWYDQINVAVSPDGLVHTGWNGMVGIGGRYHRYSTDNGATWSETVEFVSAGLGGTEGPPQFSIDNNGVLHTLTTYNGCAWHVTWSSGTWEEPTCISGREAMASNYIEQPAMTISNGNELHAVFWDDRSRLWHTSLLTGAPPTFATFPTPQPPATATPNPTSTPTATSVATPSALGSLSTMPSGSGPTSSLVGQSLLWAVLATVTLLGGVVLIRARRLR